ncbi:3-deoxy-D-manno-octulosonate 8-phosphate phosphatase KdsC [Pseudoalteromonas holothuriae]|uniref:3-deoxy-D-manno-octulosonate 8-phosphate phosphatase KdsC n=1 Tax=Pseudoalteromonas holothuriae TaxID=2963714 RepID=A0A9W4QR91_9GAMM|nr:MULTISPECIES: HAD hydrolase family protein [unclassified Pseudoalteromonas]CAH9049550.1 3-deoxy-D-manno-octulosonate 8-phosphate phosphatase KdsC [Pseudoalteromonas sp. CIP111854]CAH9067399.1 3-deoxy-D-manno-octulosonate 8-phosphate phosphatase KdsC [Pseudoalteromonas sp. CIP111951]
MNIENAKKIRMVILDVDGVMTNGLVGYQAEQRVKFFHSQDDHLIRMTIREGLPVGIISGRADPANTEHADELGMAPCYFGEIVKLNAFTRLLETYQLSAEQCLYMGDDLMDIPVMRLVGVAVCPADATPEAKEAAHWITNANGGHGAVREVLVALLKAQGLWQQATQRYLI